jgi:hypothetical protein
MRYSDWYTKTLLTVIAGLLTWNLIPRSDPATVHAESALYSAEGFRVDTKVDKPLPKWGSTPFPSEFAAAINNAAKGRELVTVIWLGPTNNYVAVFKQR